jgi:large subunit ribosomal protein L4
MAIKILKKTEGSTKFTEKDIKLEELSKYIDKEAFEKLSNSKISKKEKIRIYSQFVNSLRTNKRIGTRSVKGRSEVRGKAAKPYRQKGTGNARHGSKKSPIFVGGGVAHGPSNKQHTSKVNKKLKKQVLHSVIKDLGEKNLVFCELSNKVDIKDNKKLKSNFELKEKSIFFLKDTSNGFGKVIRNYPNIRVSQLNCYTVFDAFDYKNIYIDIEYFNEVI